MNSNRRTGEILICLSVVTGVLLATVRKAEADFVFGPAQNAGSVINTSLTEIGPTPEPLALWFERRSGPGGAWETWRASRATEGAPWEAPVNLGPWGDSCWNLVKMIPRFTTADGLEVYFYAGLDLSGGYGGYDLWMKRREKIDDDWGPAVNVGPTVNSAYAEALPAVSPDGLELYFSGWGQQDRPGGHGKTDLWVTRRSTRNDAWGEPVNLGSTVNTASNDQRPILVGDGLLLFFESNRPGGLGGLDLYLIRRASVADPWTEPMNLGPRVNSPASDEQGFLSPDGSTMYFHSNRPGGYGVYDIWQAPVEPVVDFNGDGQVDGKDLLVMIVEFGGTDALCDIGPMPWGDGVVDFEDFKVLAEYIGKEVVDPTLIAHWALDETDGITAHDMAGENDATVVGGAIWQPDGGMVGGALQFDGASAFALADAVPSLRDGPFSIVAWINGGAADEVVISGGITDWLYTNPADGSLMTALSSIVGNGVPLFSDVVITDGQWHRIGLVWDGTSRILYVDGQEAARDEQGELAIPDAALIIGAGATPGRFFSGQIDDVRIYSRAVKP